MPQIFLSYAAEDRERVRPLIARLEERGWDVWWDHDIPIGGSWPELIEARLAEAEVTIVVWSHASVRSKWVRIEAREAERRGKLVPVRIDDVVPPLEFSETQAGDLVAWDGSSAHPEYRRVAARVAAALGPRTSPEAMGSDPGPQERRDPPPAPRRRARYRWPIFGATGITAAAALLVWLLSSWRDPVEPPAVAALPVLHRGTVTAEAAAVWRVAIEGALAEDTLWNQTFLTPPPGVADETALRASGRTSGTRGTVPGARWRRPSVAIATSVGSTDHPDSLDIQMLAFSIETGRVLGRSRTRTDQSLGGRRLAVRQLVREARVPASRKPPSEDVELDPAGIEAFGSGLLLVRSGLVTAAAEAFGRGAENRPAYAPLRRAAQVTEPFLEVPLPAVGVTAFSGVLPDSVAGLAMGIQQMLITELSLQSGFIIVERAQLSHLLAEQDLPPRADGLSVRIGQIRQAEFLIGGTVSVHADSVEIEAQLTEVASQRIVMRAGESTALMAVRESVVRIGGRIGAGVRRAAPIGSELTEPLSTWLTDLGITTFPDARSR